MEPLEVETIRKSGGFTSYAPGLSLASNVLLGAQTPYDENEEAHVRTLVVKNDTNFRVCPITITEGPMKGYHALVLVPTSGFRFLDLPTEIRYKLYELSIPLGKTGLRLAIRENRDKKDPKVVGVDYRFPATKRWQEGRKFEKWIGEEGKWKWINPDERATMSLLLVNKQVSGEAFEVLYRSHTSHFVYPAALDQFLKLNGTSAKFLTNVELSGCYNHGDRPIGRNKKKRSIERALQILTKAQPQSLRSVQLQHHCVSKGGNDVPGDELTREAEVLVNECIPLLNAVYRARQKHSITTGIDEVLKICHEKCDHADAFWIRRRYRPLEECQKFDEDVRRIVRESFFMDVE